MPWTSERIGIAYNVAHLVLWGLFAVFAKATFANVTPLWSVGIGTLASTVLFAALIIARREWGDVPYALQSPHIWMHTLITGVLFYAFFYMGLRTTPAGNAAIIALFEVVTTIVILGAARHTERLTAARIAGALLIVLGIGTILLRNAVMPRGGELLILLATFIPPIGNLAGKDARARFSSALVLMIRSLIGGILLCVLAWWVDGSPPLGLLVQGLPLILFTGVILLGLAKIFWMESMHRIQIGVAIALGSLSPIITLIAGFFVLGESIHIYHIFALLPVIAGVWLVTRQQRLPAEALSPEP